MKSYYHATDFKNVKSIIENGILKSSDGVIYLTDNIKDCQKFVIIRGIKHMAVFEVYLNENKIEESFDHCQDFFNCKAFIYKNNIDIKEIKNVKEFYYDEV